MTLIELLSILAVLSVLALGFFRLHAGLLVLTFFGPFFTLLHEMSPGSAIYFLWPFALCGVMVLSIIFREAWSSMITISDRKRRTHFLAGTGLLAGVVLLLVWIADGFQSVLFDVKMANFPQLLVNRNMALLSTVMALTFLFFLGVYFREMKRREGKYRMLDFAVASLLIYGLFQVVYTAVQSGLFFVGLDGFRYYFFMLIVYFLARYTIRRRKQEHQLLIALGLACIVGAAQIMLEGYLLNVLQIPPDEMPWVGHLAKNFGYLPEGHRAFFEGGYRPLGLMYMTHFSGLFLLLGLAIWIPRLFIAQSWKDVGTSLLPLLFVLLAVFWTSRTVLLLLVSTFVGAAVLMRVSWPRVLAGGVALTLFCLFSSYNLLPGFRYDIVNEVKYIASSGFPDILEAVGTDWLTITGKPKKMSKDVKDVSPPGWTFFPADWSQWGHRAYTRRMRNERIVGNYALEIGSGLGSKVRVRRVLRDARKLRRNEIIIGAWLKAAAPRLAWLSVYGYSGRPTDSAYHSGSGKWEFVTLKHNVHRLSEEIKIEINVEHTDQDVDFAFVDGVYLVALGNVVTLMSHPSGFPLERFPELKPPSELTDSRNASSKEKGLRGNLVKAPDSKSVLQGKELFQDREASLQKFSHFLLGRGGSFGPWSSLFFPKERETHSVFNIASYSDFKYLEFFEQFGAVGLVLLIMMGIFSTARGIHLSWKERDPRVRATLVGLTLIVFIGFTAMIHLPSLFKIGINSSVYLAMAMLMFGSENSLTYGNGGSQAAG